MGEDWAIRAFLHEAYVCAGWLLPHVHAGIMATPADIHRTLRDYHEAMSR